MRVEGLTAEFGDGTTVESDNIVWATGFRFDYGWLRIPGALNEGAGRCTSGVQARSAASTMSDCRGRRRAIPIGGVGRDAEAMVRGISAERSGRS